MQITAKVHPLAASGPPNCPKASALSHFQHIPRRVFAFRPVCKEPDSNRQTIAYKATALPLSIKRKSHFDVRASVASPPFGPRNTTRRLSFTYRLLDREPGRRLLTGTPELCTRALARKARTIVRYPLPFTVDDVGVAGCTTTCSFTDLHSRPEPVHEPRYFRASLGRYPRRFPSEDKRVELAWVNRTYTLGGTPWVAPLSRRCRRLLAPGRKRRDGRGRRGEIGGGPRIQTAHLPGANRMFFQLN